MLELHQLNAFALVLTNLLACGCGASYLLRKRYPGSVYAHVLAAGQALLIAQVALGLLLLSDGRRAPDQLHYLYSILRFVFFHSIALACLVGLLVMLQAYVFPGMIVHP